MELWPESEKAPLLDDPHAVVRRVWGFERFRPLQREATEAVLAGRDCVVVLPTGGGKSLCYQLPAACGVGLTLVVSPLIALMDDQVAAARQVGLAAAALHTNLERDDKRRVFGQALRGELALLYASPERLVQTDLLDHIAPHLGLAAIDEAHCVSHWGHDFRPEYRQLNQALDRIRRVPRLALTATATPAVQADIATQLGLAAPCVLIGHPDRPNLTYRAFQRTEAAKQVLAIVRRHPGEGGIVYAQTRRAVEKLAARLVKAGVDAAPYHAGLDATDRQRVQEAFVSERLAVVVATVAFGMGIDRSNVRFVVHANAPKSVEHYQQESGRAGRDGLPAECVLLFGASDTQMYRRIAADEVAGSPERERALDAQLRAMSRYAVAPVCRHRLLTEHFGQPYPKPAADDGAEPSAEANCQACDVCLEETIVLSDEDASRTAQMILSAVYRTGNRFGSVYVTRILRGVVDDRVLARRHDSLSVFGLLKSESTATVRAWIDQLIAQGCLALAVERGYPLVKMTDAGVRVLRGREAPRLTRFFIKDGAAKKGRGRASIDKESWEGVDRELFQRLRELRTALAGRAGVPPYVVFGDVTLRALAREKPTTLDQLGGIRGIGEVKRARYGRAFLAVIADDTSAMPGAPLPASEGSLADPAPR